MICGVFGIRERCTTKCFYCKISSSIEVLLSIPQGRLQPYLGVFVQKKNIQVHI